MSHTVAFSPSSFATFGELLRYLRRRARLQQRDLAIAVGYSEGQICRLEQNQRLPDLPTLAARFVPALDLEDEPELAARLLDLAVAARKTAPSTHSPAPPRQIRRASTRRRRAQRRAAGSPPPRRRTSPHRAWATFPHRSRH